MLAINLVLALAPSLLIVWWAYRRDSIKKESIRLLFLAFLLGLIAVVPAVIIGLITDPLGRALTGSARTLYRSFVVAALVEEAVKFALLSGFVRRHEEFDEATDGIVYGMTASLGFAFLENILYVGGPSGVLILRGITAVPLHAGCGAIVGYYVGRAHFEPKVRAGIGLLLAILVHGVYDALVFSADLVSWLALVVIGGLVVVVPLLFRHALALDVAAGRVRVGGKPDRGG